MKVFKTKDIKNVALIGAKGSGKTTLAESIMFEGGVIKRRGTVEAKNTVCDYFPVEQEYGYSVFPTVFAVEANNKKLNFIDCPGSDDFVGGSITAMNVTDLAAIVINAQYGPEVGTQNAFRNADKCKQPVMFVVNQLDKECDYEVVLTNMKEAYGSKVVPVQFPVSTGQDFNSVIDLILMKKLTFKGDGSAPVVEDIPAEFKDKAEEMRAELTEMAAENDEALMDKFFETEALSDDEIREGIRKGLISRSTFPVFCVCGQKCIGVNRLMEFLTNCAPNIDEMPKVKDVKGNEIAPDANGALSVFFFKTAMEPHIGEVSYFKVMSGTLKEGMDLANSNRGSKERLGQIFTCAGSNREKVDALEAGDIGCTVKLKDVKTGNTLNDKNTENRFKQHITPNSPMIANCCQRPSTTFPKSMNLLQTAMSR